MSTVTFAGGRGENVTELTAAIPKERQRPSQVSPSVYWAPACYQLQTYEHQNQLIF